VKTLKATLELYRAAIQDGARAYGRGIIGAFGLLIGSAFLLLVSTVLGPLLAASGGAGSLLFGLFFSVLTAYVIGAYLACVEAALDARKMLPPSVLKDAIGHYFGECIGTMFWLWIGGLLLGFVLDGSVAVAVWFVLAVLFNPVPELLYNKRTSAPKVFEESARWVWSNWPEWFAPQVIVGVLAALFLPALSSILFAGGWMSFDILGMVASAAQSAADVAKLGGAPLWRVALEALLVPLVVHAVMVFRGALFRRLDRGNRRARAWAARLDE
jgi:hypothetical protein